MATEYSDGTECSIGDVVKLKCGSPLMVVTSLCMDDQDIVVAWTPEGGDSHEVLQQHTIAVDAVEFQR